MHVAVVGDLVAAGDDVPHEVLVSLGNIAGNVEAGRNCVPVQQVENARSRDRRAVLARRHEARQVRRSRVAVDRAGYAVDVKSEHHHTSRIAWPDSGHGRSSKS